MEDGAEHEPQSTRRRRDASGSGALSVADLLARHGAEPGATGSRGVTAHRLRTELDETEQFFPEPTPSVPEHPAGLPESAETGQGRTEQMFLNDMITPPSPIGSLGRQPDPDEVPTAVVPRADGAGAGPDNSGPDNSGSDSEQPTAADADADQKAGHHRDPEDGFDLRCRKIDESLTRLTAIHAGMGEEMTDRVSRSSRLPRVDRGSDGPPNGPSEPALAETPSPGLAALTRFGKVLALAVAVALFVATGASWGAKQWLDAKLRPVAALDPNSDAIVDKAAQYGDENFLLVGSDTRDGAEAADRAGSASTVPGARSDTVMVAHIPAKRDRVVLVSFPRDLEVDRPNCDRWDAAAAKYSGGTAPAESGVKINTAFETGGPRCMTKVVQKLTGLAVNHFTAIDFAGFKEMVDAVAGVPICLDRPVLDGVLGRVVPTAGQTVLGGDQALAFVRARHVRGDPTSDYGRIQRQQRFLSALLRKGLSDQVLLNPGRLRDFVTAFGSHTLSDNAGLDELTTLASSLRTLDPAKVTFVTVPTVGEPNGRGNEVLRASDTRALFEAVRSNQPLPGEGGAAAADDSARAPDVTATDTVPPSAVTVTVRNASSRTGLANQVSDTLRTLGFTVAGVGDAAPAAGGRTIIRHSPDRADQATALAEAVPAAVNQAVPGGSGVLELVLGNSFDGELKAAAAATDGALPANLATVNGTDASCR